MNKIAIVVPSLAKGGGVPAVARFVKDAALRSNSFQVKLVSLCMDSNEPSSLLLRRPVTWLRGPVTTTADWDGLPFTHVGANWAELEFQRYQPRRVLADLLVNCDLIQVVCGSPAWANSVAGLGKPVALQVATRAKIERRQRDANPKHPSDWWRRMMTEITDRLDDRALRHVDAIQVENPWMLDYARNLNAGRVVDIRYAPPGINAELFRPLLHRNVSKSSYILCVGRLDDPRKNVGLLLSSYALLSKDVRDRFQLLLAGSSPPPPAFWQQADALNLRDRVSYIFRPSQEELVRLYQEASVFVSSSDEEGLGVAILEAMACAVPVVSTRSGGPDGIISDGEDGYLVPLDAASEMAARLQLLLENPSLNIEMGLNARATIEAKYDERVAGAVFVKMWDQLLGNT
ncbi:MAG: glycosyltransferase [Bacteroidia bacterium]|nr:glycosyltransferase [Bacteroidia bacterium]